MKNLLKRLFLLIKQSLIIKITNLEELAQRPISIEKAKFNNQCELPYGLEIPHIALAMEEFIDFLKFLNQQLRKKGLPRLESFLMPANFSSIVGEFMNLRIPEHCPTLAKNQYHNGHPDLIPNGHFPDNAVQHSNEGIEVKGSRHSSGWQGHNPEAVWLMVFHFDSNTSNDQRNEVAAKPFEFKGVYAAKLEVEDWSFSGRSPTSRRTITASVIRSGVMKMKKNWVYGV